MIRIPSVKRAVMIAAGAFVVSTTAVGLEPIQYNHPGLIVDLGVGLWAWPLPMDFDGDGDLDLVVTSPDASYGGTHFFENVDGPVKMPVFKASVRIGRAHRNIQPSYVDGKVRLLVPGHELIDFRRTGLSEMRPIHLPVAVHPKGTRVRNRQLRYVDYDGDGVLDLIVGIGDGTDYGWDDAYDAQGRWTHGPLHGYVYVVPNAGTNDAPKYGEPRQLEAGGQVIDVYGMPTPNLADFDGDGDLDILCGEFLDGFSYFENVGTRREPRYARGRQLRHGGQRLHMDLQMIVPVAIDWDRDGDIDLIVGDEDGRVALVEHTGRVENGLPQFLPPVYFQQQAASVKFGALTSPVSFDWDGDGDEDLLTGNTAGYIGLIENLDGGNPPRWAAPRYLTAAGEVIRFQAGDNGSIQGPCEAKWGYTTLDVADWDHDGRPDLVVNSIWGRLVWFRNVGTRTRPDLAAAAPIEVEWKGKPPKPAWNWWDPTGKELVTQWRTQPVVTDLTGDGLNDLILLDHEGYLVLFERIRRDGRLALLPPKRVFRADGPSVFDSGHRPKSTESGWLRLNNGTGGGSGRRKFCLADWDGDGRQDLLVNSLNVNVLRNVSTVNGVYTFHDMGKLADRVLAGHATAPAVVDWNRDGVPDLLVGAEDGFFYYMKNPRTARGANAAGR